MQRVTQSWLLLGSKQTFGKETVQNVILYDRIVSKQVNMEIRSYKI